MINGFVNVISKSGFQNTIQNTTAQVSIETGLKAFGRPAFTLIDSHADKETRKYSAAKELLYQLLCLGIYLAVIPPIFKKGGFKLAQKVCNKINQNPNFKNLIEQKAGCKLSTVSVDMFKNEKGLLSLYQLGHMSPTDRINPSNEKAVKLLNTLKENLVETHPETKKILENIKTTTKDSDFFKQFHLAKGSMEISSIAGSVIGLTILAPELSHLILHPIMRLVGLEKPHNPEDKKEQKSLDKQA